MRPARFCDFMRCRLASIYIWEGWHSSLFKWHSSVEPKRRKTWYYSRYIEVATYTSKEGSDRYLGLGITGNSRPNSRDIEGLAKILLKLWKIDKSPVLCTTEMIELATKSTFEINSSQGHAWLEYTVTPADHIANLWNVSLDLESSRLCPVMLHHALGYSWSICFRCNNLKIGQAAPTRQNRPAGAISVSSGHILKDGASHRHWTQRVRRSRIQIHDQIKIQIENER